RFEPAQPQTCADLPGRTCGWHHQRSFAHQRARWNANGKHLPDAAASVGTKQLRNLRRQHGPGGHLMMERGTTMLRNRVLIALSISTIGLLVVANFMIAAGPDTRVADAAMKGDRDQVRSLIKEAVDVNGAHGDGMTALHWAAQKGDA